MVEHKRNGGPCFRTVNGHELVLNLTNSPGNLCLSLRKESIFYSYTYKEASSLGLVVIFSMMLQLNLVYLAMFLLFVILTFILYDMFFLVEQETVLIVKGLGYQIQRKFHARKTFDYIPYERVQTIFINEVILRHTISYVITLQVQEVGKESKLVSLFKDLEPKLDCLEIIYRDMNWFKAN